MAPKDSNGRLRLGNIYPVMAYRIILVMFLFTLCRIGFFLFNRKMFPGVDFGQFITMVRGGLVFDISAIVYINMLFILLTIVPFDFIYSRIYQKIVDYIYLITNGLAISINGMDFVYYKFIGKRATAEVFRTFSNEEHVFRMFFRFLADYWPATLFTISLLVLMVFLYNRVKLVTPPRQGKTGRFIFSFLMMDAVLNRLDQMKIY
jgi:hypothetical protein